MINAGFDVTFPDGVMKGDFDLNHTQFYLCSLTVAQNDGISKKMENCHFSLHFFFLFIVVWVNDAKVNFETFCAINGKAKSNDSGNHGEG